VIGAGGTFDREQRRARRMTHGVIGAMDHTLEAIIRRLVRQLGEPLGPGHGRACVLQDRALDHRDRRGAIRYPTVIADVAGQLVRCQPEPPRERDRLDPDAELALHGVGDLRQAAFLALARIVLEKDGKIPVALRVLVAAGARAEQHDAFDPGAERRQHPLAEADDHRILPRLRAGGNLHSRSHRASSSACGARCPPAGAPRGMQASPFSAWVNLRPRPAPPPNHPSMVPLGWWGELVRAEPTMR
jgi:hypothetical protein